MYASLGRGILELFRFRADPGAPSPYRMTPALVEALERARSTGAVLASGHTGNWELAGARIAREIGLTAIVQRQSVGWAHRFIERVRHAAGIELLYPDAPGGSPAPLEAARAAVASRRAVFMMIDQRPAATRHAVEGDFLGGRVWIGRAPAALAARTRAPLHLIGMHRAGDGDELELDLLATYDPPVHAGRSWIEATMRTATQRLDQFVRAHPTDWMWLHRRWSPPKVSRAVLDEAA